MPIPYGRTEFTLASEFKISVKEAREMIKKWFEPQPETKAFMETRRNEPLQGIVYESPTGRRRTYGIITEFNKRGIMNESGNFPIQGPASDCTVISVTEIVPYTEALAVERNGERVEVAKVVNSVHDSIILQVRASYLARVAEQVSTIMSAVPAKLFNTDVPFRADFEAGYRWGDIKEYDYKTGTIGWEAKDADGNKVAYECEIDIFRKHRGNVKAIVAAGENKEAS